MAVPERVARAERLERERAGEAPAADRPAYQAYLLLYVVFIVAPIVAGADKFFHLLANWPDFLAPEIPRLLAVDAQRIMLGVGVVEIVAGLLVAMAPRIGGAIVGLWLCGIVANLLWMGSFFDIALRDVGLALAAFALSRLATSVRRRR